MRAGRFVEKIAGILMAVTLMVPVYWYNEGSPVSYSRRAVLTPHVPPGGTLRIAISAEINKPCIGTVYRSIIDAANVKTDYQPETRPATTDYIVEVTVPLGAAPGPAAYLARVEWVCNPLQRWFPNTVLQSEIPFIIAPAMGQVQDPAKQGVFASAP